MISTTIVFAALSAFLFTAVNCQQDGSIRLYNYGYSSSLTSGIVEVYYNSRWNTICRLNANGHYTWGIHEADVACHQLGYEGAISYSYSGISGYGQDSTPLGFNNVDCISSSYLVLMQCTYSPGSVSTCSSQDQVTVSCSSALLSSFPYTGMVRLVNGVNVNTGRAEVYCNGQWGTMCEDSSFSPSVAKTVCYQLGYNDYQGYQAGADPGSPDQPIWLSDYLCTSAYFCISECQTCPAVNSSTCGHSQDVSVTCQISTSSSAIGSSLYTCNYVLSTAAIFGIVIAAIVLFAFCVCLWVGVPICICCCLGVGIGAAAKSRHHHHYDHF